MRNQAKAIYSRSSVPQSSLTPKHAYFNPFSKRAVTGSREKALRFPDWEGYTNDTVLQVTCRGVLLSRQILRRDTGLLGGE
jgi:hypothetical protein